MNTNNNKKIIFLEGLPGVGKTTILKNIGDFSCNKIKIVNEIINTSDIVNRTDFFILNDDLKMNLYDEGLIIIDRGMLSTISYEQTKKIIDINYNAVKAEQWFEKIKDVYLQDNIKVIYFMRNNGEYFLPYNDEKDPYGSIENQDLLENITIFNIKKYVKNFSIVKYNYSQMEEVINEIIN